VTKTALVLGATGFIGGHIALEGLKLGWEVRGLRREAGATGHIEGAPLRWYEGNLDQPASLFPAMEGVQLLFHAAAYYPQDNRPAWEHTALSVQQIRGVLETAAAAGVERMIFTSSLSTIGQPLAGSGRLADEHDRYLPGSLPDSAYYECKYAMESEVLRACAAGQEAIITNPTLVLGPGDLHLAVGRVIVPLVRGWGQVWLPGDVNAIDVRDVARAHIAAAEVGKRGERFILGGHNLSVHALQDLIADEAGVRRPKWGITRRSINRLARLLRAVPGLRMYSNHLIALSHWQGYDTSKARSTLGLRVRALEETIGAMIAWYRDHGYL
jgi:dihydroflavonol-4-reductase